MKGLFVLLAVVAVASAGVPANAEKGIIQDILAVKKCLDSVVASVQKEIAGVIEAMVNLTNVIVGSVNDLKACAALVNPIKIAKCVNDVSSALQSQIVEAVLGIQQSISGLVGIPGDVMACIKIIGS